jgi:uncharacterized membrane protein YebE (DUF533 family)
MGEERNKPKDPDAAEANTMIAGGLGIGAFGVISAAIGGAVCPVCVVAAPALLGVGAYKRWKAAKAASAGASAGVAPATPAAPTCRAEPSEVG